MAKTNTNTSNIDNLASRNIDEKLSLTPDGVVQEEKGYIYASFSQTSTETVASGRFSSDGATVNAYGISCTRNSTGVYTVTFDTERPDENYIVNLQLIEESGDTSRIYVEDGQIQPHSFRVRINQWAEGGTINEVDRAFYVLVSDIFRQTTETELTQPIVCTDSFGNFQKVVRTSDVDDTITDKSDVQVDRVKEDYSSEGGA